MVKTSEDETREYMIRRAKTCLSSGDSSYAKSWIMTANALFPQNDKIKMESYEMSKCEANVEEAMKYLCEMFDTKECEQQLTQEFNKILISCRNEWQTHHLNEQQIQSVFGNQWTSFSQTSNQFYVKLFGCLSSEYQYKLLRRVSERTEDKLVLIDLLLFILKKFPESVVEIGIKLIEIMDEDSLQTNTDTTDESNQHLSQYLKRKLVFDVLPLIFANNSKLILEFETIQKLMQKTLKYFVEKLISSEIDSNCDNLDTNHIQDNSTGKESEELLEHKMNEIFQLIGHKNEWKLFSNIDFVNEKQLEVIYDKISHFIDEFRFRGDTDSPMDLSSASTAMIGGDEDTNQQILYATLVLFLQCLHKYSKLSSDIVLIEEIRHSLNETKVILSMNKKRKLVDPELFTTSPELRQLFTVASKALKLLQENLTISSEFLRISDIIGLNSCHSYHSFVIDSNLFRAEYNEVLSLLLKRKTINIKNNLQLISVSLMLHDYKQTLKYAIDSIECLSLKATNPCKDMAAMRRANDSNARHLFFLPLNLDNILSFIIDVIILCLKDRVLMSLKPSDIGVGHLLVLSQYKWPNDVQLFMTCMSFIRKRSSQSIRGSQSQPKFSYQHFFNYVFIPDIIEDFMSIVENEDILLELKSSNSGLGTHLKTNSKSITTRGVNKGFKEENKSALLQQMIASKTQIPNELFIEFIHKEIKCFLSSIY